MRILDIESIDSLLQYAINRSDFSSSWLERSMQPHTFHSPSLLPPFAACWGEQRRTALSQLSARARASLSRGMKRLRDLTFPFQSNSYVTSYFKCIAMYSVHILNSFDGYQDGYKICPYFSLPTLPDFPFSSSCVSSSFTMKSNSSSVSGWTLSLALANIANIAKGTK